MQINKGIFMNLSSMSVAELRALQEQITQEIKAKTQAELVKAREEILAIAQNAGISLKDLLDSQSNAKNRAPKTKVAVRYRHPANGSLQWTGRGRQPKWVQEWVAAGKTLDDLRV
jgi:DNA-binding protein H-NS